MIFCLPNKLSICALVVVVVAMTVFSQHLSDPEFKAEVERPAYLKNGPRLMFDEAHNNFHTSTARYKPFAELMMNDGYRVVINRKPFTRKTLDTFKILVVANALGDDIDEVDAEKSAFSDEEIGIVGDWVRSGGALLLIAGPGVFAKSAASLAKQFGVEMDPNIIEDPQNPAEELRSTMVLYSRENHQLIEHPITTGRDNQEKVNRVVVFTGQSLKGPPESVAFLKLSESARNVIPTAAEETVAPASARGVAQGLAFKAGNGRVVVLGEANMVSAMIGDPPENEPIGMNYPGIDNKELTLNILHWLSGLLK